jgi:hypothetical protein
MSMDASGKFADTLVFSKWKGRPTVRQLVTPANPQSADQQAARNAMRVLAAGQSFCNFTTQKRSGETMTDKAKLISLAPPGQAWNGYLVKAGIGVGAVNFNAASAAYAALTASEQTAWNNRAASLSPAILLVPQVGAGGMPAPSKSAGEVFFHYVYALYIAGAVATAPGAVPPTYS